MILVARSDDDGKRRSNRDAPGHERGAACRATGLTIPAGEPCAFLGELIHVRCWMTEALTSAIATEGKPAGVILHQHEDIWFLVLSLSYGNRTEKRSRGHNQRQGVIT